MILKRATTVETQDFASLQNICYVKSSERKHDDFFN